MKGGFSIPFYYLLGILFNTLAFFVHPANVVLGLFITLFCCKAIPMESFHIVLVVIGRKHPYKTYRPRYLVQQQVDANEMIL